MSPRCAAPLHPRQCSCHVTRPCDIPPPCKPRPATASHKPSPATGFHSASQAPRLAMYIPTAPHLPSPPLTPSQALQLASTLPWRPASPAGHKVSPRKLLCHHHLAAPPCKLRRRRHLTPLCPATARSNTVLHIIMPALCRHTPPVHRQYVAAAPPASYILHTNSMPRNPRRERSTTPTPPTPHHASSPPSTGPADMNALHGAPQAPHPVCQPRATAHALTPSPLWRHTSPTYRPSPRPVSHDNMTSLTPAHAPLCPRCGCCCHGMWP